MAVELCARCEAAQERAVEGGADIQIICTCPRPTVEPLKPRELGKDGQPHMPWGAEWLLAHTPHYTLKRLEMRKGASGPFQHHVNKFESFVVHSGRVMVTFLEDGEEASEIIGPGQGFTIPPGAPHRVEALAETVLYEASTPHFDDRVDDSHLLA